MALDKEEFKIQPNAGFNLRYVEMAARLKAAGMSNEDIGIIFGFSQSTIQQWIKHHPLFKKAIEDGKNVAKGYVLAQAFRAACGYDYDECNEKFDAEGNLKEKSVFHKHMAPNPKLIMWLVCNLDKENWQSEHKITVENDRNVTIKLDGNVASKQIERLAGRLLERPVAKYIDVEVKNSEITDTDPRPIPGINTEAVVAEFGLPQESGEDSD